MLTAEKNNQVIDVNAKILILGLGQSGVSVARFLRTRGQKFIAVDTRTLPPDMREIEQLIPRDWLQLGALDQDLLNTVDTIVISPGLALKLPSVAEAIQQGVEVIGDIELFARYADAPIVAITGSNGKTTVTSLLGQMAQDAGLKVSVGGNIGVPALDLLNHNEASPPAYYLLELSSFQLETVQNLNADIVTVLNISPDHMDRYNSVEEYAAAKYRIYEGEGIAIINKQELDRWGDRYLPQGTQSRQILGYGMGKANTGEFGLNCNQESRGQASHSHASHDQAKNIAAQSICYGDKDLLATAKMKLLGSHNIQNVLAALTLGKSMGISIKSMVDTISSYPGLPHRTEWVAKYEDVTWINDSKGTNVGATIAALEGLSGDKILIAGGVGKDADFLQLRKAVTSQDVKMVVLFGQDAARIEMALNGCVEVQLVDGLKSAVQVARQHAKPGWLVLFSPACASFDSFKNYEERGEVFKQLVLEMLEC